MKNIIHYAILQKRAEKREQAVQFKLPEDRGALSLMNLKILINDEALVA